MKNILNRIKVHRIVDDLWELVNIPSPTCREREASFAYARMLTRAGAHVRIDETIPQSPSIIGVLIGNRPGKTIQLAGHIDHIDVPHEKPWRTKTEMHGRGAADMKNGLAAILETIRVLKETGCDFPGRVLVTVYGLHEAPLGNSEGIKSLIRKGIFGDAALVAESGHSANEKIVLCGKGQAIWDLQIRRSAKPCHELNFQGDPFDVLQCSMQVVDLLKKYNRRLQKRKPRNELLTPESVFVGQMHYGDFYNRVANTSSLQGTRRWCADTNFKIVKRDFERLIDKVKWPGNISMKCDWTLVGEAYDIKKEEPVANAMQKACVTVYGRKAGYAGLSIVVDAHRLVPLAKTPTVLCGFDNEFAHADDEYIRIGNLLKPAEIMVLTVLNYLKGLK
jgi:acetylornithine deacetylase/succinyl-diaminopimelate desuccinylase-like protein